MISPSVSGFSKSFTSLYFCLHVVYYTIYGFFVSVSLYCTLFRLICQSVFGICRLRSDIFPIDQILRLFLSCSFSCKHLPVVCILSVRIIALALLTFSNSKNNTVYTARAFAHNLASCKYSFSRNVQKYGNVQMLSVLIQI